MRSFLKKRRVVVITGASAGVGRAIARRFAREGACVGLIARGKVGLQATLEEVEKLGGKALPLPLDVSDATELEKAAFEVEREFGPIDVWINNAMVSVFSPVDQMLPEEFKRVTEVTYLGCVYGTLTALHRMKPRNRGVIIQIGSALAYRSIPLQSAYCAAKHAIAGFTESLRTELLHDRSRVKVCEVNLPAVNTPQFGWTKSRLPNRPQPVPPIYQPEVIAHAVHFVSRHPRRRVDIAYPTIQAVIAEKIAPSFADHYLAWTGYSSQQTDQPVESDRKDNLWKPVEEDRGAHGTFDSEAIESSPLLWLDLYRNRIGLALASFTALGVAFGFAAANRRAMRAKIGISNLSRPRKKVFQARKLQRERKLS